MCVCACAHVCVGEQDCLYMRHNNHFAINGLIILKIITYITAAVEAIALLPASRYSITWHFPYLACLNWITIILYAALWSTSPFNWCSHVVVDHTLSIRTRPRCTCWTRVELNDRLYCIKAANHAEYQAVCRQLQPRVSSRHRSETRASRSEQSERYKVLKQRNMVG